MTDIRTASIEELAMVLDWAAAEGWNPGLGDAEAFHAADPAGFFVAYRGTDPAAAISVVNHSEAFSFLGLYIVAPAFRGQGIGLRLWTHALQHAGSRTVGLDGVPAQQDNYAASGFISAGGTTRFAGRVDARADTAVRAAQPADIPALIDREARASGQKKSAYLSEWFRNTPNRQTLLLQNGGVEDAFCTVRACRDGAKIGPLLASNVRDAEVLIAHAASLYSNSLMIDVPDASPALAAICAGLALAPGFETARMYRGPAPKAAPQLFAVASLELG